MKRILTALAVGMSAISTAHAQSIPANERLAVSAEELAAIPANGVLRIETDLANTVGVWTGVRSCGDEGRVRGLLTAAFERWVGQQVNSHPGQQMLRNGWTSANFSYSNSRKPWPSRARVCRGSFRSIPAYIEFRRG